jgi:predicted DNA-binding ribbon-helix-helix protein
VSDEARRSERERRELAQQHAGEVVEDSGRAVAARRLGQMVSLRLEPELASALRELANRRGTSVSELLREAAIDLLANEQQAAAPTFTWHIVSVPGLPRSYTAGQDESADSPVSVAR